MPTSITLKNIPEPLYQRIKQAAQRNHRSLNSEIIASLEKSLAPYPLGVEERMSRLRELRDAWSGPALSYDEIAASIDRDRD